MENVTVSAEFIQEVKKVAETMLTVQARILTAVVKLERETYMEPSEPAMAVACALHVAAKDLATQWSDLDLSLTINDLM